MTRTELIIQLLKVAIGLAFGAYFVWWSLQVLDRLTPEYDARTAAAAWPLAARGRNVLPILKDRRLAGGERHQLLHLAMGTSRVTNRARRTPVPDIWPVPGQ
jgi:hypothetical protein